MPKNIIRLETYPQINKGNGIFQRRDEESTFPFEVERDWLERKFIRWGWGSVNSFIFEYTYAEAEHIYRHYIAEQEGLHERPMYLL